MKKQTLLFIVMLATLAPAFAQRPETKTSKIYIRAGAGYAFTHAGQANLETDFTSNSSSATFKIKKASLGAGVHAVAAVGFMLHPNIGVELGADLGVAPKKYTNRIYNSGSSLNQTSYAKMPVYLVPAVVLQTGSGKLNAYSRLGVVVPLAGKMIMESNETDPGLISERTVEYKNWFGVGFQGALGARYLLGPKLGIWVEANGIALNSYIKSGKVTTYTENGMDKLSSLQMINREATFEFEGTAQASPNVNEPYKGNATAFPYSNIGISAGLLFNL